MTRARGQDTGSAGNATGGWLCLILVVAAIVYLFRAPLFAHHTLLFRDVAHFYGPLWEWARTEWGQGRIPLWDPFQNLGEPHLADSSSSVFYPGKLLFLLPGDFQLLFHVFLVLHVGWAAWTMFRLVRAWRGSVPAAGLAAVSYCLGGGVLFQYCNPPFLIGAAWLPSAIGSAERVLRERTVPNVARLAAVLAMMVLGGDAQTVYHVGLMMVLLSWMQRHSTGHRFRGGLGWIALAAALTFLLTAVQVLPSASRTAASDRATFDEPRSLYELASAVNAGRERDTPLDMEALLGRVQPGTHHERAFQFSVGPWRWLELVWPNVGGRMFPRHARWMSCLPAEGRIWVPTLYLGLLPMLLAVCRVLNWRSMSSSQAWVALATLFSILAALGSYGGGWLVDELRHASGRGGGPLPVGWGFGGLYWLMTVVLPGYVYFRYPAKLWTIATCGISLLAAMGWDRELSTGATNLRRGLAWLGGLSAGLLVTSLLTRTMWLQVLTAGATTHDLFGPFDVSAAAGDFAGALSHAALVCGIGWLTVQWWARQPTRAAGFVLLIVTAVELVVAQRWLVPSAHVASVAEWNLPQDALAGHESSPAPRRIYRGNRQQWHPPDWATASSPDRLAEIVRWDRQTLFPQYQHAVRCGLLDSPTTLRGRDWSALAQVARQFGPARPDAVREFSPTVLDVLGADGWIVPRNSHDPGPRDGGPGDGGPGDGGPGDGGPPGDGEPHAPHPGVHPETHRPDDVVLEPKAAGFPRVWVVSQVIQRQPLRAVTWERLLERTCDVWFPGAKPRDLRRTAVVESSRPLTWDLRATGGNSRCRIVSYQPQRIVVAASLTQDGLVVLGDAYASGWHAWARRRGSAAGEFRPLLRTNRVLKGVWLEAGEYEIVYRYLPAEFLTGLLISGVSWTVWLALVTRTRRKCPGQAVPGPGREDDRLG